MTMVELLVAMLVLGTGLVPTVAAFVSARNASILAQRQEVAIAQAQREMERLRAFGYDGLGLTAEPSVADRLTNSPNATGYFNDSNTTAGSTFTVSTAVPGPTEHLVLPDSQAVDEAGNPLGRVSPGPSSFVDSTSGVSGRVYRFVTWRDETCGANVVGALICPGYQNTKRLLVAVTIDAKGRGGLTRPVWITSIVTNPQALPYE
jgi:type II secretory pathway pseudopilin PulG